MSRLPAIASEQLMPELSQGGLVAKSVDRPWQVAWIHVAQAETSTLLQICRQTDTEREIGEHAVLYNKAISG